VKRRKFLRDSTLASLAGISAFAHLTSCVKKVDEGNSSSNSIDADFELSEITIDQLQEKMQSGQWTARSITEMYLKRIEEIDKEDQNLTLLSRSIQKHCRLLTALTRKERKRKSADLCMESRC
jgi:amidase